MAVCWLQRSARVTLSTPVLSWFRQLPAGVPGAYRYLRTFVIGKMNTGDDKPDARSWRKAYGLALSIFAVEVALLYLFTIRFS